MNSSRQRLAIAAAPYVFTIAFFAIWEAACRFFKVPPFFLPAPSVIGKAMVDYWWQLLFHSFHTLWMTVAGFLIAVAFGILLGIALGASRIVNAGSQPLLVGFNAIPKVAVVPILILWFGVGWIPPVMTAFLISFFPIVVNVATGLSTIEPELEDVMKALGARKWDIMVKIGIPRSLPYLFGSLKVAITLAYVGSVIAESNASNFGIGNLITRANVAFNVPLVFAALIALAVLGVIIYAAMVELERRTTGWAHRSGMAQGRG
jgi:NitT/TauT family transport system permease protein